MLGAVGAETSAGGGQALSCGGREWELRSTVLGPLVLAPFKTGYQPARGVHSWNPTLGRLRQEGLEF